MRRSVSIWFAGLLSACTTHLEKPAPLGPPVDGKLDGSAMTIEHDALIQTSGESVVELTDRVHAHAWRIQLGSSERLTLSTAAADPAYEVDTILYLYAQREDGTWGEPIDVNDDSDFGSLFAHLVVDLQPGAYRLVAAGFDTATRGAFAVRASCDDGACEVWRPVSNEDGGGPADVPRGQPVTLRVPVLGGIYDERMSFHNPRLSAAGLPTFPETVTLSSDAEDPLAPFQELVALAHRDDVYAQTGAYMVGGVTLRRLVDAGMCYEGDGTSLADFLPRLSEGVVDRTARIWGWRAGDYSAYGDTRHPPSDEPISRVWQMYDRASTSVMLVITGWDLELDPDVERVQSIPLCE